MEIKGKGFEFKEDGHKYYYDGREMTGVTSILGTIAKPALISWSARMATKWIRENCEKDGDNFLVGENDLKNAEIAHSKLKDSRAKEGTSVHKDIENYILGCIRNGGSPNYDFITTDEVKKFHEWAKSNVDKFIKSEMPVYHSGEDRYYAGTLDFLFEKDDNKYIGDIKTTSGIYDRVYFAQCAAYRHALEYCDPELAKKIKGSVIVRIGKDGSFEYEFNYAYEKDLKIFLAALTLYRENKINKTNTRR